MQHTSGRRLTERPRVVDFFCGCGGTSAGFRAAGLRVSAGVDNDESSSRTFKRNFPEATFFADDLRNVKIKSIQSILDSESSPLVFAACAPCQPFSKQRRGSRAGDVRASLLMEFFPFVKALRPECIFIENVPGMQTGTSSETPLDRFRQAIEKLGYSMVTVVVLSASFGVPQRRSRLIALASRVGDIDMPKPTHGPGTKNPRYATVKDWIGDLPPLTAGDQNQRIPNHRAAGLSALNLRRIRATPEGGGRESWPSELISSCHSGGYTGHTDVYGRMSWNSPASGLTTRCISYSNGRFGHPSQDRAISVREAASLQTFPRDFVFEGSWESMGRQIGNAVPVLLAEVFGRHIINHLAANISKQPT